MAARMWSGNSDQEATTQARSGATCGATTPTSGTEVSGGYLVAEHSFRDRERGFRATERVVGKVCMTGGLPVKPSDTRFASLMSADITGGLSGMALVMADSSCLTCKVADVVTIVIILDGYRTTLVVTRCTVFKGKEGEHTDAYRQTFYHYFSPSTSLSSTRGRMTTRSAPMRGRSRSWRRWRRRCGSTSPRLPSESRTSGWGPVSPR
jgi:hypothetical protein